MHLFDRCKPTRALQPDFTSIPYQRLPPPGHFLANPDFNWDNMPEVDISWPRVGQGVTEGWLRGGFTPLATPKYTAEIIFSMEQFDI